MSYTISPKESKVWYEVHFYSWSRKEWMLDVGNIETPERAFEIIDQSKGTHKFVVIQKTEARSIVERD